MPMEQEPVVGAMYEDQDGIAFEVLSLDEDDGTIEIQYEDGSVDEIDIDNWYEMDLDQLEPGAWKEAEEEDDVDEVPKRPANDEDDDEDDDDDLGADEDE
jgi:hypothetical protein